MRRTMTATGPNPQPGGTPRTNLERRIRDRRMTLEEFVRYAEVFAMANHENGTISLRHLQRLISGRAPATRLRPATARLLERIFKEDIRTLLAPECSMVTDGAHSLRVAIAIVTWDTRVLLVARRGEPDQIWQFPAGMVKPEVQADAVAVAETLAETGVYCATTRRIGSRLHPRTRVHCDYYSCRYVAGEASNLDPAENTGVVWAQRDTLTQLIPRERIYPPVLAELELASPGL